LGKVQATGLAEVEIERREGKVIFGKKQGGVRGGEEER
jgi:hypothetical protein